MGSFDFRLSNFQFPVSSSQSRMMAAFLLALACVSPSRAEKRQQSQTASEGEFFIISSVNASKQQLVLKHPTEVTELVRVTDRTTFLDEQGKSLQFQDLRAGDTVHVTLSSTADGTRIASRIRKGPMTVEELRRRYLKAVVSGQ